MAITQHHQPGESYLAPAQCDVKERLSFPINVNKVNQNAESRSQALCLVFPDGTPLDSIAFLVFFGCPQRTIVRPAPGHNAGYLCAKTHY